MRIHSKGGHTITISTTRDKECLSEDVKGYIDLRNMTYWECKLFANEADARKSFG